MQTLAERLTILREEHEWTKTYVAKQLGLKNLGTYANWEYGTREPDNEMLTKIANLYKVSTDYLLGLTDDRSVITENDSVGNNILSHFRLNTADMEVEDIEELEEELNEYMDFLVQRAKAKKNKK
ncbi:MULTISPECIES: helix-turn-helix domain-containing protein [Enterococcus]|uniref:Transcriptional regulator n=1 Tax=Enterococcus mundtii TaxID=53346 RepID=A0A1V2UJL1_ENTMU|nr:helix-turn-helix transcriptional regulator [Enterococcus mundtii]EGP5004186.1 helix-turn-helix transcriptional regulator [Enterococcus faecium]EGP5331117.1 XRE family transcriptional regulator [Enterococcus faecium]EGP5741931.1 XRE family transcriptional regulator [Enterococcus faecium]EME8238990.1 helix-turn-helix transcriptional regulator [Enterococcus faecium]EME8255642.1 helix-turn-helix transcriptional regulator [Enterococcus faecium]